EQPQEEAPTLPPNAVRAIYAMVIIMTILIVAGIALVIGRIIYLANKSGGPSHVQRSPLQAPAPELSLPLPAGAKVAETSLAGNRLVVRYSANGEDAVMIYDVVTGRTLSRIRLRPEAAKR
ncbi:MAG: hypothetical protein KDJ36_06645, partial [Hyphomicrobiaceae bacterium]|nr:hypothetical protein [Hyphomicrobiaceae bacterium]